MMSSFSSKNSLMTDAFKCVSDPRSHRNSQHLLIDILMITICAVICGAEGWEDIETFSNEREEWLRQYLKLPYGLPGHDTYRRVFSRLNPKQLQEGFRRWVEGVFNRIRQVVAVDGKSLRRSFTSSCDNKQGMLHRVSAWATEQELVLGQIKTDEKSNEITAIPELLKLLAIDGCIVTIDAMGCQEKIARQIISQKADYILAVKDNQLTLHKALQNLFNKAQNSSFENMVYDKYQEVDAGHGRIETRTCITLPVMYLHDFKTKWPKLQTVICLDSKRELGQKVETDRTYENPLYQVNRRNISNT